MLTAFSTLSSRQAKLRRGVAKESFCHNPVGIDPSLQRTNFTSKLAGLEENSNNDARSPGRNQTSALEK